MLKVTNVGGGAVGDAVDITIVSSTGAVVVEAGGWTELVEGNIQAVSPASGQQGTVVTLTGSGLLGGGSDLVSVTLAGTEVDSFDASSTTVTVEAGSAGAGVGDIILTADTGAVIIASEAWEYVSVAEITSVNISANINAQGHQRWRRCCRRCRRHYHRFQHRCRRG